MIIKAAVSAILEIRGLSCTLGGRTVLRQIDLRGNPIETLPDSFLNLPKLEKLDLRWVETLQRPAWLNALEERGCLVYL